MAPEDLRCRVRRIPRALTSGKIATIRNRARMTAIPDSAAPDRQAELAVASSSALPHDLAAVQRLGLARRLAGTPIRHQVVRRKGSRVRRVSVQRGHQRRSRLNQPHPRVATAVDPTLVALGQAEPTLQLEVISDPFVILLTHEQAGQEAQHHRRHPVPDRILGRLELIDQRFELLLPLGDIRSPGLQRRGHLRDHGDVLANDLLLFLDFVQAPLDASGQTAELLLREAPFFASKFRWSDSWTSLSASAIRKPGGCNGPP